jgi:hypothetical protein
MALEAQQRRSYGNWRRPRPPGLWHLGFISSVLFILGIIATIAVMAFVGLVPGLVVLALQAPLFLVTLKPGVEGRTPLQRIGVPTTTLRNPTLSVSRRCGRNPNPAVPKRRALARLSDLDQTGSTPVVCQRASSRQIGGRG